MNHNDFQNIVIMTATISPPAGVPGLSRVDPSVRLNDYRLALEFYLSLIGRGVDAIVFAENSNSDVGVLRDLVRRAGCEDRVEFIVFAGLDYPPSLGRGHGEMRLLEYAMDHSEFIRGCGPECVLWKVTGRYKIVNLAKVVRRRPATFDVYCDLRDNGAPWCDMRVMAWTRGGYDKILRGVYKRIGQGGPSLLPEQEMHEVLTARLGDEGIVPSYVVEPFINGVRAFDNRNWSLGRQRAVYYLRTWQRSLLGKVVW